ncbi:DUF2784 domain-containing protein [Pseudomonas caricapapayae]|uniref:DUF2784 domain-containing protein n=1 Tax=Pseudomonas caricapapayae TaxID=46678 RepID=A0ACC7M3U1_9PSED
MLYRLSADGLVLFHLLFIVFVLFGGLLVLKWRGIVWWHVPAMCWGIAVEFLHLYCPLTDWENSLRQAAGQAGYEGGFIEHYILPIIYPAGLTAGTQVVLGSIVVLVNALVYVQVIRHWPRRQPSH